jgi:hypothetical protein
MTSRRTLPTLAAVLFAAAPKAFAQIQPQNLAVEFVTAVPAPLTDWLTAGVALLLAATAFLALRRRNGRGTRVFGWLLAIGAGAALLSTTGGRVVTEAQAVIPAAAINLVTSPGTLDVSPYWPTSPLDVVVTNSTGRVATITNVTLVNGNYAPPTVGSSTCLQNRTLSPGGTCILRLFGGT